MLEIFLQLFPFFTLIGIGYLAVYRGFLARQAIVHLTQFVFYFALSAMLFDFASRLPIGEIFDLNFVLAYASASILVYIVVMGVAHARGCSVQEGSIEAQSSVIGNIGFLALPVLVLLFGEAAAAPVLLVLTVDLVLFGSLVVAIITGSRDGRLSVRTALTIAAGLGRNPMVMAILCGLVWSVLDLPVPGPVRNLLVVLGAAATPCALFSIGGSLVERSSERLTVALWLSFAKLVLHPLAVGISVLYVFQLEPFNSSIMIACAAMPVAGNIYIIAQHYGVAPQRASASILVSTVISVVSLTAVITLVSAIPR